MNKKIRLFIILFLLMGHLTEVKAQQRPRYSQYMFNGLALNPAYAGSHRSLELTGLYRVQWTNVKGAPRTATISGHSSIRNKNMGVGFILTNDNIGVTRETGGLLTYSYTIKTTSRYLQRGNNGKFSNFKISFGLQAGFNQYSNNLTELKNFNSGSTDVNAGAQDPVFAQDDVSAFAFDLGTGIYIYNERMYFGVSSPNLIKSNLNLQNTFQSVKERHFFVTGGIVLDVTNGLKVKPNFLFSNVIGGSAQIDVNLNFLIADKVWIGGSYRHQESAVGILEIIANRTLRFGYSYDYGLNNLTRISGGTHELMLNYFFQHKKRLLVNPRYF